MRRASLFCIHRSALRFTLQEVEQNTIGIFDGEGNVAGKISFTVIDDAENIERLHHSFHLPVEAQRFAQIKSFSLVERLAGQRYDILQSILSLKSLDYLLHLVDEKNASVNATWANVYACFVYQTPRRHVAFPNNLKDGRRVQAPIQNALWTFSKKTAPKAIDYSSPLLYGDSDTAIAAVVALTESTSVWLPRFRWLLPPNSHFLKNDSKNTRSKLLWQKESTQMSILSRVPCCETVVHKIDRETQILQTKMHTKFLYDRLILAPALLPSVTTEHDRAVPWPSSSASSLTDVHHIVIHGHLKTILAASADLYQSYPKAHFTFIELPASTTPGIVTSSFDDIDDSTREQLLRFYPHATFMTGKITAHKAMDNKVHLTLDQNKSTIEVTTELLIWTISSSIDDALLAALHDSSITVDRHIVVDAHFRTNDARM